MSEKSLTDGQSDTESLEEEIEPKLKYVRLANHLQRILLKDAVSCISVHPRFICLGSHFGLIYTLDHLGNIVEGKEIRAHTVAVNQISIESSGEFIASCSDDGKIFIHGLYSDDRNDTINVGRVIKTIALDPNFNKSSSGGRFIIGDHNLTLYEKTFLGRLRPTVLCGSEGLVRSISWGENFIAWSSDIGVRVYDINARCSLGLIKWENNPGVSTEKFRCNLRWADARTLLIGWVDTVRVCIIRKRSSIELGNRDLPEYLVDPISTFQTEFYISGIAPLDHQLVLLGFPKEVDANQKSLRPQLYIVEYRDNDYVDICTDSLSLRGYEEYTVNDYHLEVLIEENRFFIVAPKDVVIASPYDLDDRIQWLIQHGKFEEALNAITQNNGSREARYTVESVGIAYLDHLLGKGMYDMAGKLCLNIFGHKKEVWEEQIFKFATVHQLRSVSPYIPRSAECTLDPHMYEMILYEYLKLDSQGFLKLVKEWSPSLYNTCAVINAVLEHLLVCDADRNTYLEALAMLYSYEQKYDKSLSMYLQLKNKDVFNLIQKHNLYGVIHDMIVDLMDLDYEKTIALLLEKNRIPAEVIVDKLKNHELQLYRYLDAYDKINSKGEYHGKLVKLYAVFARDKLLPFLRRSDHYPIQEALDICQKDKYYPEMVYLLGRVGDTKEALELITKELKDMQQAIEFCQEHDDPDLWNDLINHSLDKPDFITYLLQHIGTYVDPTVLVEKIKKDEEIPGLKNSLVKMLRDYNLQVSVQEGCKKILVSDYFNLHNKLVKGQQKGIALSEEMVCGACHRPIIIRDLSRTTNLVVYNCKHCFHEQCLVDTETNCGICHPTKKT
ncbi:hypothetical protein ILUMI_01606 [Ignelater luminosus]|uniref:Vacuolar protein sorting-associated protein 41 homolog n=1 Tax=Ignelater luminosus TaxID=2038154 RepID=A0A8K0GLJ7_IGNLU|nr:hypothetical protein ILUMI_01606 [Ignelater luminosus]